jgi:hypothetical protein
MRLDPIAVRIPIDVRQATGADALDESNAETGQPFQRGETRASAKVTPLADGFYQKMDLTCTAEREASQFALAAFGIPIHPN